MGVRRRSFVAGCAAGVMGGMATTPAAAGGDDIATLVRRGLDRVRGAGVPGVVIGAFTAAHTHVEGAGVVAGPGSAVPDGRTIFQLGSITKTFTGVALARAAKLGLLSLSDPLASHLPSDLVVPVRGRPMTLADVATHSSGLPSLTAGFASYPGFDPRDPYAAYTWADLVSGLRQTTADFEPGTACQYSNFGFALLGLALSWASGREFHALLREWITGPLGLADTVVEPSPGQRRRLATGHDPNGQPTPDWHLGLWAGAGALYGAAHDLMRHLRACLGHAPAALLPALRLAAQPHFTGPDRTTGTPTTVGLGWQLLTPPTARHTLVWHNGGTGGFESFAGFAPDAGSGVVALGNRAENQDQVIAVTGLRLLSTLADRATRP